MKLRIAAIILALATLAACALPTAPRPEELDLLVSTEPPFPLSGSAQPPAASPDDAALPSPVPSPSPTPSPTPAPTRKVKLQFAGDVLLHSNPVKAAKTGTNTYDFTPFFTEISSYMDGDLVICNVETPIDVNGENASLSSYPMFNAPYEILPALKELGFNLCVNANNHSFDKGFDGLVATRASFGRAGLDFVGTYETQEQYDKYKIIDVGGIKVGVIAYTDSLNGLDTVVPESKRSFAVRKFSSETTEDVPGIIADMDACRAAGAEFIILSLHWGAEYQNNPSDTQKEIARLLCEGGADIIMGNHAHCVQPIVWLPGKDGRESLCMYSLGNFFADQINMDPPVPKTQYSMLVSVSLTRDDAGKVVFDGVEYLPTYTYRYQAEESSKKYAYSLTPAATYANSETLLTQNDRDKCKKAWEHVTSIVGDTVEVSSVK